MRDSIYCSGSLLDAVQKARLFEDCKTFVDMPLRHDAETVITNWNILWAATSQDGAIPREVLQAFVDEHFDQPGNELEECSPVDWNQEHAFDQIADPTYRAWAKELHQLWPKLTRRVRDEVHANPGRFSLLALPKAFVIPGGRFRELYYWDTFFSIQGLLKSGMLETVRGMIENMCHLIQVYGHVYNGTRIYYKNRSQPPLLTWCVQSYFAATQDLEFLRSCMPFLETEMAYFMKNKRIQQPGWKSYLFRFFVVAEGPRPESYREDVESAEHLMGADKNRLWGDICAAAESGRDFSCRWFATEGEHAGRLSSMRTSEIAPVELNAIICRNMRLFSEFYNLLGDLQQSERYRLEYEVMREAIHQVFWNEEQGIWLDFDLVKNRHIETFHDTHLFPLFAECAHDGFDAKRVVDYLEKTGALSQPGGLPTSLSTGIDLCQWDAPNGWSPTNWIAIQGLRAYGQFEVAKSLAEKWVKRNYAIYRSSGGKMFEKYNVMSDCLRALGGAGEYECQEGFGWTNAVILDLLHTFGSELVFNESFMSEARCECCRPPAPVAVEEVPASTIAPMIIPEMVVEQIAANICMEVPEPAVQDTGVLLVPAI